MGTLLTNWGHIHSTAGNSEELEINLFPGELLNVSMRIGGEIICQAGQLWITQEGDSRDYVLTAGDRFQVGSYGLTLIESLPESKRVGVMRPKEISALLSLAARGAVKC